MPTSYGPYMKGEPPYHSVDPDAQLVKPKRPNLMSGLSGRMYRVESDAVEALAVFCRATLSPTGFTARTFGYDSASITSITLAGTPLSASSTSCLALSGAGVSTLSLSASISHVATTPGSSSFEASSTSPSEGDPVTASIAAVRAIGCP